MKQPAFLRIFALVSLLSVVGTAVRAQQNVAQSLALLDEKVSRMQAQIEDLQFQLQKTQKDTEKLQADLEEMRRSGGGVSSSDIKSLDDRISAVDAARQKDKQAIIDQLAKELAAISAGRPSAKASSASATSTSPSDAKEHVVQKGDTLSSIAKSYGVTVADLKKANNLAGDDIKIGQKLVIPK